MRGHHGMTCPKWEPVARAESRRPPAVMGNTPSASTLTRTTGALDSFVAELGHDIIYDRKSVLPRLRTTCSHSPSLGSARFLKTIRCRHRSGYVVIKVFVKPDPGLSLINYQRRLKGPLRFSGSAKYL